MLQPQRSYIIIIFDRAQNAQRKNTKAKNKNTFDTWHILFIIGYHDNATAACFSPAEFI